MSVSEYVCRMAWGLKGKCMCVIVYVRMRLAELDTSTKRALHLCFAQRSPLPSPKYCIVTPCVAFEIDVLK
jgi:hypothetical protein